MDALRILATEERYNESRAKRTAFTLQAFADAYPDVASLVDADGTNGGCKWRIDGDDNDANIFEPRWEDEGTGCLVVSRAMPIGGRRTVLAVAYPLYYGLLDRDARRRYAAAINATADDQAVAGAKDSDEETLTLLEPDLQRAIAELCKEQLSETLSGTPYAQCVMRATGADVSNYLPPWDREDALLVGVLRRTVGDVASLLIHPRSALRGWMEEGCRSAFVVGAAFARAETLRWRFLRAAIDGRLAITASRCIRDIVSKITKSLRRIGQAELPASLLSFWNTDEIANAEWSLLTAEAVSTSGIVERYPNGPSSASRPLLGEALSLRWRWATSAAALISTSAAPAVSSITIDWYRLVVWDIAADAFEKAASDAASSSK